MSVRIEGGLLKGLPLKTQTRAGVIRPTSGKVRQALFNIIADRIEGCAFADLFAGSAAVAFEALSRGASRVVAVEKHPQALALIRANADLVTSKRQVQGRFDLQRMDASEYCDLPEARAAFDVAFADPPFTQSFAGVDAMLARAVKEDGLAIVQFPTREPPDFADRAHRLKEYGESTLAFFTRDELARAPQGA